MTNKQESESSNAEKQSCCCAPPVAEPCCPTKTTGVHPSSQASGCCSKPVERTIAGYRLDAHVVDWLTTAVGEIPVVSRTLSRADYWGRMAMRWGIGRDRYKVAPGLYALGQPDADSEVLVSANYKLSFDILRHSIPGRSVWLLVIDTNGVNVWCAAGKGTFGTDEIVKRVKQTRVAELVNHKRLIVPQLGAPGVAAHKVKQGCALQVIYGPVRAKDLPAFFAANRQATAEMRRVNFTFIDRLVLTPVEITILGRQILYLALVLLVLGGIGEDIFSFKAAFSRGGGAILAGMAGVVGGCVITPLLLPWLPGRAFALKGLWPGAAMAILVGGAFFAQAGNLNQFALLLETTAISSYTAMNFTGSSTFTSPSGVEKEMRAAIPCQLIAVGLALTMWLFTAF